VREIITEPEALHRNLKRINVIPPADPESREDWPALAKRISQHDQVLVIVNRRDDARELAKHLPQAVHLSANLCGEHRSRLIRYIKWWLRKDRVNFPHYRKPSSSTRIDWSLDTDKLKGNKLCVVSTQLIEAGVDVDFPVVFRAYAGLDSIAQAAGRCNREGRLEGKFGQVFLFNPPKPSPRGLLLKGEQTAKELLSADVELTPDLFERYFSLYYGRLNNLDKAGILGLLCNDQRVFQIQFRAAAENFCLIDDEAQQTVIVRYGEASKLIERLKAVGPKRDIMRKLQRYSVSIPRDLFKKLLEKTHEITEVRLNRGVHDNERCTGIYVQDMDGLYHPRFGFIGGDGVNPLDLIV
jgi:CRISPR-associated endonuclease/helicase Cas3